MCNINTWIENLNRITKTIKGKWKNNPHLPIKLIPKFYYSPEDGMHAVTAREETMIILEAIARDKIKKGIIGTHPCPKPIQWPTTSHIAAIYEASGSKKSQYWIYIFLLYN